MKILQLGRYYPPHIGGIESVIFDITEGLNKKGIQCDVLCSNQQNKTEISTSSGYKVIRSATLGQLLSTSMSVAQILHLRKIASEYDIVHVHHPDPMAAVALFLSGFKNKVIVHWHSDIVRQKLSFELYKPLQNWLLKRASKIIVTSENYGKSSAQLKQYASKISAIPIGTDVDHPVVGDLNEFKKRFPQKFIVFALGRMVYYKGFEYLIRSAEFLNEDYCIVIGGDGPLRKKLTEIAQQINTTARIVLPGRISQNELSSYFAGCSVFCLPSIERSEAFGVVLLEAMSYAKPIIATNITGSGVSWVNQEMVTGLNVDVQNPKSLAEAIMKICNDPALAETFSKQAKERYATLFTRTKMIDSIVQLLKTL